MTNTKYVAQRLLPNSCRKLATSPSQPYPSVPEEYPIHADSNAGCRLKGQKEGWAVVLGLFKSSVGHNGRGPCGGDAHASTVVWVTHQFLEIEYPR